MKYDISINMESDIRKMKNDEAHGYVMDKIDGFNRRCFLDVNLGILDMRSFEFDLFEWKK